MEAHSVVVFLRAVDGKVHVRMNQVECVSQLADTSAM